MNNKCTKFYYFSAARQGQANIGLTCIALIGALFAAPLARNAKSVT